MSDKPAMQCTQNKMNFGRNKMVVDLYSHGIMKHLKAYKSDNGED